MYLPSGLYNSCAQVCLLAILYDFTSQCTILAQGVLPHLVIISSLHSHSHSCPPFSHSQILFNNAALSGTIPVEVTAEPTVYDCNATQRDGHFCKLGSRGCGRRGGVVLVDGWV